MGAYVDKSILITAIGEERLRQLADPMSTGSLDDARINLAIDAAEGEMNSYIVKRYKVPVTPVTSVLRAKAIQLAVYELKAMQMTPLAAEDLAAKVQVTDWLKAIAEGKVAIDVDPQPTKSSMQVDKAYDRPSTKDVSREKTKGYW